MQRRTFLSTLSTVALAGGATAVTANTAAAADSDELELEPGTTFSFAETSQFESFIYAPLSDGSTYYLFEERNGCCDVDEIVLVLSDSGEVLFFESLDGVQYTEDEIGAMADRIGEMADRIVYTEELIVETEYLIVDVIKYTQDNTIEFVGMLNPLQLV